MVAIMLPLEVLDLDLEFEVCILGQPVHAANGDSVLEYRPLLSTLASSLFSINNVLGRLEVRVFDVPDE
ncbi:unnamed protein product [Urochloa humidicola]